MVAKQILRLLVFKLLHQVLARCSLSILFSGYRSTTREITAGRRPGVTHHRRSGCEFLDPDAALPGRADAGEESAGGGRAERHARAGAAR